MKSFDDVDVYSIRIEDAYKHDNQPAANTYRAGSKKPFS